MVKLPCVVLVLIAGSLCLSAQTPEEVLAALRGEIAELKQRLAEELGRRPEIRVNGTPIDPMEVKREAVYVAGAKLVEAKLDEFFTVEQMRREIEGGRRRPEEFVVDDDDVATALASQRSEFEARNPGVDFWRAMCRQTGLDQEGYRSRVRQTILFDRTFFPGSPKQWPEVTIQAIQSNTMDDQATAFLAQLEKTTDGADAAAEPRTLPRFWLDMVRQLVRAGLRRGNEVRYASHGLPSDVVLRVNGLQWSTDDAFRAVGGCIGARDLERAQRELALREALRQELVDRGAYVSDGEFAARYDAHQPPQYPGPINLEVWPSRSAGYPSLETFRARWRLVTSYADLIEGELDEAHLQAHADHYAVTFGGGRCDVDLIPFRAIDPRTGTWRADGMEGARARAFAVFAGLAAKAFDFDEARRRHGEFLDDDETLGRLGLVSLDDLERRLGAVEHARLLDGYSISRHLFFDAAVATTVGPLAGPDGWFLARVNARAPTPRKVDLQDDHVRALVREDCIRQRFFDWANGVIARSRFD